MEADKYNCHHPSHLPTHSTCTISCYSVGAILHYPRPNIHFGTGSHTHLLFKGIVPLFLSCLHHLFVFVCFPNLFPSAHQCVYISLMINKIRQSKSHPPNFTLPLTTTLSVLLYIKTVEKIYFFNLLTSLVLFYFFFFHCFSSTVIYIFPPPLPPTLTFSTSHP